MRPLVADVYSRSIGFSYRDGPEHDTLDEHAGGVDPCHRSSSPTSTISSTSAMVMRAAVAIIGLKFIAVCR